VKTDAVKNLIQLETRNFCTYVYCLNFVKIGSQKFVLCCGVKWSDM